jgi:arginase
MGRGPEKFLAAGASRMLEPHGHNVNLTTILRETSGDNDLEAVVEVNAKLAAQVRAARENAEFPLVLAGTCNSCLGTLAGCTRVGLGTKNIGIVWFDAHGDFNTPETSPSGFLDGMALAMAAGLCHNDLLQRIGLHQPIPLSHVVHVGGRDFDPPEWEALQQSAVQLVTAREIQQAGVGTALHPAATKLREHVDEIYLHVDIDVLNATHYPANEFPAAGGLSLEELTEAIRFIGSQFSIRAVALTAYNPDYDPEEKTLRAGLQLLQTFGALF